MIGKPLDLTGQRFGSLTVIERIGRTSGGKVLWRCLCECSNDFHARADKLLGGRTISCGCRNGAKPSGHRNGTGAGPVAHGGTGTSLYRRWAALRNRCSNPNNTGYRWYGARGIKVCAEWGNFEVFREWAIRTGFHPTLTIDRLDVDGDYTPENCAWVTRQMQIWNRRVSRLNPAGVPWSVIARGNGIKQGAFQTRIKFGWDPEKAATTPVRLQAKRNRQPEGATPA